MRMEAGTTTATTGFYAGVNQPATTPAMYLWTPLVILAAGIVMLAIALIQLSRSERRELPPSFFDQ